MKYKFGVTQWGMPGEGMYIVQLAKEAGLDGVQLETGSFEKGFPMCQKRIRDKFMNDSVNFGIEFPSLVMNDLCTNGVVKGKNCETGKIAYNHMQLAIEAAVDMNIKVLMFPSFFANFIETEEDFKNTVEALKFCCDMAGVHDITVAHESVLNVTEQISLMDAVNMPNLKLFFDTQNYKFFKNFNQMEILGGLYPQILDQLHVKDGIDAMSGSLLGEGLAQFEEQIKYLKEKEYSGWYIFENYFHQLPLRTQAEKDQLSLLFKDIEKLKSML